MKVLLDTQVFLWWNQDSPQLSPKARRIIVDPANTLVVSVACAWEIAIKVQIGKLRLPSHHHWTDATYVQNRAARDHMEILPIDLRHVEVLQTLPQRHRDPFDRILIAQSLAEEIPILTADETISGYPIETIW